MREPLTQAEKDELKDIRTFNVSVAAAGWHLQSKNIEEDLSGILLTNSTFHDVEFAGVKWRRAILTNTQFTGVEFVAADFGGATLTNVTFRDCKFDSVVFSKASFRGCSFVSCAAHLLRSRDATFEGCAFESFSDESGVFGGSTMTGLRFDQCSLNNTSIQTARLSNLAWRRSKLKLVIFGELEGSGLTFEDTSLEHCAFGDSDFGEIAMDRCRIKAVAFDAFAVTSGAIRNSPSILLLNVVRSRWHRGIITDSSLVTDLVFEASGMTDLAIGRCKIENLEFTASSIAGNSGVTQCQIGTLNLTRLSATGMRFQSCEVQRRLLLDGAEFHGLQVSGLSYGQALQRSEEGVRYLEGSAQFR